MEKFHAVHVKCDENTIKTTLWGLRFITPDQESRSDNWTHRKVGFPHAQGFKASIIKSKYYEESVLISIYIDKVINKILVVNVVIAITHTRPHVFLGV